MGLYAFEIEIIAKLCAGLPRPFRALSLGHPDILATPEALEPILSKIVQTDNHGVRESRNWAPKEDIVGNARPVFRALGGKLTVFDIRDRYGVDIHVDLNAPQAAYKNWFDLIIDPGTTEHCFNVGQAFKTIAESVKLGGYVYHMVPLCHWNHGFWNFSPCAFHDFYSDNGFEVVRMEAEHRSVFQPIETSRKFKIQNQGTKLNLLCIVRKTREVEQITFPLQGKYR